MPAKNTSQPVYDGEYEDAEWRRIAAKKPGQRSRAEQIAVTKGPRRHGFGPNAYSEEVHQGDSVLVRHFESKEAARSFKASNESGENKLRTKALKGQTIEADASDDVVKAVELPRETPEAEPSAKNPAPEQAKIDRKAALSTAKAVETELRRP